MIIDVENVGPVEFPDDATQEEVTKTLNERYPKEPYPKVEVPPGQLDESGRKPYPGFLKGAAFSPYQAESMQEAADLLGSLQESVLPESKSKGVIPAVYNTLVRPVASPIGIGMIPALAESLPLRVAAGLGFGGMAAKSGLEKLGSPDPQTQLEGRIELASAPLMAFLPGAETKKGALRAKDQIESASRVPVEQQSIPVERGAESQVEAGTPQRGGEGEQTVPQPSEVQEVAPEPISTEAPPVIEKPKETTTQPRITIADLSKTESDIPGRTIHAKGAYSPLTGQTLLDKESVSKMTPEERASVVRHELAHKIETERELWNESDTYLWDLWSKDRRNPIWDFSGELTGRVGMRNDVSPEIIAELYAKHYPKGTFTVTERPNPYEWEGENISLPKDYPIPEPIMGILDRIEDELGIWTKKAERGKLPKSTLEGFEPERFSKQIQPPKTQGETTTPPEQPVTTPVPGESVSGAASGLSLNRQVGELPKGTKVELTGNKSQDPLNAWTEVKTPDGNLIRVAPSWLTSGGKKQTLPQLIKSLGRDKVEQLIGEWDQNAELSEDGSFIRTLADPRNQTGKTKASVKDFVAWVSSEANKPKATPEIVGMGGATPPEFEKPGTYVSNMFAAIDRDRAEMGKPPMEPGQRRTWDQDNQIALSKMNHDPDWTKNLIKEVLEKPRPLLSWENAALVWQRAKWKAEANNAMKRIAQSFDDGRLEDLAAAKLDAARFEDEILNLDAAVGKGGTGSEAGRSLKAQQMGTGDDFSLIEMRLQRRTAKGGEKLTPKEESEIQKLYEEQKSVNERLTQHLAERDQKLAEAASREAFLKLENERIRPKASDYVIQVAEKWVSQLDKKADAARIRIRERLSRMSAGVDPTLILDLAEVGAAHIGHVGLDFAKWSLKMIEDFGEKVKPFLQEAFEASKKNIDSLAVPKAVKETIKKSVPTPETLRDKISDRITKDPTYDISPLVQALARMFVKSGVKTRDALIDKVHELLKTVRPETTRRETMDLISGYGQLRKLSKDQVSVELRDLKGQMQQVAKLEDMANKKAPLKTGLERRIPSDEERRLIQLVNESKFNGGYEITDPSTQLKSALQTWKTNVRNRMVDLQRRIDQGDFVKKAQRELKLDNEALQMQAKLKRIRKQWREGNFKLEQSQREWWQRGAHAFVKWERAFKLSSPVVFGKLAAAAMTRAVTTVAEEAVGGVQSKLPVLSRIAAQAPREGGASVKAIADGLTQAILRGGKAAKDKLTKGGAEIEFAFGDKLIDKDWVNIFGNLHGAMKAPVVEGEFALSLNKRIQHAIRNGVDVTDPFVMTRLQTEALNDGYRAIFMQHGFFSDWFNASVTMAEKSKKYPVAGELSARAARFLLPIVRVPMNIVSETSTGIHGLATASMRTMYHAAKGTLDTLPPELADSIMRQFKKGSIGAGLIALGYLNPQAVGGYDWREKRKARAVKTGGFQIAGVNIPRWMTHAPWFELMQFGATVRHVKDRHTAQGQKTIPEGLWAAALGLLEQTPFYGQMVRMAQMKDRGNETIGEFARSTLVPQAIQKIAELDDPSLKKRKAKTIAEHVKLGIPGLRETVKTTNEKR